MLYHGHVHQLWRKLLDNDIIVNEKIIIAKIRCTTQVFLILAPSHQVFINFHVPLSTLYWGSSANVVAYAQELFWYTYASIRMYESYRYNLNFFPKNLHNKHERNLFIYNLVDRSYSIYNCKHINLARIRTLHASFVAMFLYIYLCNNRTKYTIDIIRFTLDHHKSAVKG